MNTITEKHICLALLYRRDCRYTGGRKPICFTTQKDFCHYVAFNRNSLFPDQVLIILLGGSHEIVTLNELEDIPWVMTE